MASPVLDSASPAPDTASGTANGSARSQRAAPSAQPRRNPLPLIIFSVVVAVGGYFGFQRWNHARGHESTDNAQVDGHIVPIIAKVGGYVERVNASENQHVAEAAPLVIIDDREYKVRLAQAEADLSAAIAAAGSRGHEGQAAAMVQTASSQRAVGDAQVVAARANVVKAQGDLDRAKELVAKQIVSRASLDAAQAAFDAASATLVATERQVSAAQSGISGAEAGVRLAQARLQAAQAARDNAQLQLSFAQIASPVAGTITKRMAEVGQLVQPGQTLMSVVADTGMFVTANFKETQLAKIRVGQKVELEVDAYEGAIVEGQVESISSATGARFALLPPDNATGNFTKVVQRVPVRIRITGALSQERPLRPGMSVQANVVTK